MFLIARSYSPSVISAISGEIWPVCLPTKEVESYEGTKATVIFFPSIKIIFSMIGVDLDILNGDPSGDRLGEDRRRVQKIFCSQTPRAGGDD